MTDHRFSLCFILRRRRCPRRGASPRENERAAQALAGYPSLYRPRRRSHARAHRPHRQRAGVLGGDRRAPRPVDVHIDGAAGGEAAFAPLGRIREALDAALPAGAKAGGVGMPRNENGCYKVYYEDATNGDTRRLCIDPYTAKVLGDRVYWSKSGPTQHSLMSFLFQLHWSLLLYDVVGDPGVVVGVAALLLVVSVATGIYLWWPSPRKRLAAFTLKRNASSERLNYDLHKLGGVYTAAVMIAVLISGVSMNLSTQFQWVVELFSPLSAAQRGEIVSGPAEGRTRVPFEQAVGAAARRYPEGRLENIGFPKEANGVYEVCRKDIAEISRFIGTRCVMVDQYSGETLGVRDPTHGTAGDVFMQWQWPLHSGRALGWTGRILVFVTGLVCPCSLSLE